MTLDVSPAYGLWLLAFVNAAVFIIFALSFSKPQTPRDWRSFGAFSAFLVALFAEMYGFPLTIYLLSGWLQSAYPGIDWFSHNAGHLPETLFGWRANPHFGPFHLLSFVLIGGGFWLYLRLAPAPPRALFICNAHEPESQPRLPRLRQEPRRQRERVRAGPGAVEHHVERLRAADRAADQPPAASRALRLRLARHRASEAITPPRLGSEDDTTASGSRCVTNSASSFARSGFAATSTFASARFRSSCPR